MHLGAGAVLTLTTCLVCACLQGQNLSNLLHPLKCLLVLDNVDGLVADIDGMHPTCDNNNSVRAHPECLVFMYRRGEPICPRQQRLTKCQYSLAGACTAAGSGALFGQLAAALPRHAHSCDSHRGHWHLHGKQGGVSSQADWALLTPMRVADWA